MNSYLVRIYREEENNPRSLVGTVEEVGASEKRAFCCLDELWAILNPAGRQKKPRHGQERRVPEKKGRGGR